MRLYHGSNIVVESIDLSKCRPYKDFGRGFYLTDIPEQSQRMAERTVRMFKGSPEVSAFEFNYEVAVNNGMRILKFDSPSIEWAEFVMKNRNIYEPQPCHDYDIVIGPVADDTISKLLRLYTEHFITGEQLVRELTFSDTTSQYLFHTAKAVEMLSKI